MKNELMQINLKILSEIFTDSLIAVLGAVSGGSSLGTAHTKNHYQKCVPTVIFKF